MLQIQQLTLEINVLYCDFENLLGCLLYFGIVSSQQMFLLSDNLLQILYINIWTILDNLNCHFRGIRSPFNTHLELLNLFWFARYLLIQSCDFWLFYFHKRLQFSFYSCLKYLIFNLIIFYLLSHVHNYFLLVFTHVFILLVLPFKVFSLIFQFFYCFLQATHCFISSMIFFWTPFVHNLWIRLLIFHFSFLYRVWTTEIGCSQILVIFRFDFKLVI